MEYRKLISFGKSSFVVSLPKSWVNQNKLKKGDLIYIDENEQTLILSKSEIGKSNVEKSKTINIDGKSLPLIRREVNSAYIMNYRTISLKGNELKDRIKELQEIFQTPIALEVMEQTSNSIIAKDFLNMEQVSVEELIRKMDIITRTMLKESGTNFLQDNYKNINERDSDVNRLYFLLYRTILFNLDNPTNAFKKFKLKPIDLLNYLLLGYYLEGIADEARRTARFSRLLNIDNKEKNALVKYFDKINNYYLNTLKAVYAQDEVAALSISTVKIELNSELDTFEKRNLDVNFANLVSRIRRLISYIHSLGRVVYQGHHY